MMRVCPATFNFLDHVRQQLLHLGQVDLVDDNHLRAVLQLGVK